MDLSGQVLFTSKSLKRPAAPVSKDLPQAIRPAVEIIARLSAERARLRDDVERLQEELRRARATDTAKLRAELESMRHERDELRTKVREMRRDRTGRASRTDDAPSDLAALVERMERAVNRLEGSNPTLPPPRRTASPRPAPIRAGGGGMLAGLVTENAKLRDTPRSGGQRTSGGGGMLAGLVTENAKLRETPRSGGKRTGGGGGMLAGLVKENAKLRDTPRGGGMLAKLAAGNAQLREQTAGEGKLVAFSEQPEAPAEASSEAATEAADEQSIKPRKQSFARSLAAVLGLGGRGRAVEADDLPGERQAG